MRTIKFRAWNKTKNRLVDNFIVSAMGKIYSLSSIGGDVTFEKHVEENKYLDCLDAEEEKDFILMEFTGLLDKNGKEIYEGDILNHVSYGLSVVGWKDGTLGPDGMSFDEHEDEHSNYKRDWEVSGNVYENGNPLL